MFCMLRNQDAQPHTLAMTNASKKRMFVGSTSDDTNTRLHISQIPIKKFTIRLPAIASPNRPRIHNRPRAGLCRDNSYDQNASRSKNCQMGGCKRLVQQGSCRPENVQRVVQNIARNNCTLAVRCELEIPEPICNHLNAFQMLNQMP